uniref:ribosomal protein L28 n=1 Tax=Caulacanthus ustulatus TaxID=31411 RepID=UPI0027DA8D15|nr:ribosomal protein L28 [Caulacanthus ustulatus]WCH57299.1 ribosomal protein L28 [Caulacanthus ustulatus]
MSRICQITKRKANNAYAVSHSHIRTKKKQGINLQHKKIWSTKQQKWIKLRIATKTIKSLCKIF